MTLALFLRNGETLTSTLRPRAGIVDTETNRYGVGGGHDGSFGEATSASTFFVLSTNLGFE